MRHLRQALLMIRSKRCIENLTAQRSVENITPCKISCVFAVFETGGATSHADFTLAFSADSDYFVKKCFIFPYSNILFILFWNPFDRQHMKVSMTFRRTLSQYNPSLFSNNRPAFGTIKKADREEFFALTLQINETATTARSKVARSIVNHRVFAWCLENYEHMADVDLLAFYRALIHTRSPEVLNRLSAHPALLQKTLKLLNDDDCEKHLSQMIHLGSNVKLQKTILIICGELLKNHAPFFVDWNAMVQKYQHNRYLKPLVSRLKPLHTHSIPKPQSINPNAIINQPLPSKTLLANNGIPISLLNALIIDTASIESEEKMLAQIIGDTMEVDFYFEHPPKTNSNIYKSPSSADAFLPLDSPSEREPQASFKFS
jgi:hypothetical protein